ncbi:MAG: ATP-grasp domain-containing protein [Nocardioides sp.]|nr:ATP-grasp domain-containing protein [Nocardioides sp.]
MDVFWPRLRLAEISASRRLFEERGIGLVAGPAEAAALLDDKARAYADAEVAGLPVPPYRVVSTGDELQAAYDDLQPLGGVVCKPVDGVGAEGYRVLTRRPLRLEQLLGPASVRAHVDEAATALDTASGTVSLLVMPYLPGPEVSVDCLADDAGELLAAVPRSKVGRVRRLVDDPEAVEVAAAIVKRHRLSSLSNTQVRYWRQPGVDEVPRPYLLETNSRVAGGIYQTRLAGVNIPWAAVCLAAGREVEPLRPRLGAAYTTVSTLVEHAESEPDDLL